MPALTLEKLAIAYFLLVCFSKVCGPFKLLEWGYFAWYNDWLWILWPTRVLYVFLSLSKEKVAGRSQSFLLSSIQQTRRLKVVAYRFLTGYFIKSWEVANLQKSPAISHFWVGKYLWDQEARGCASCSHWHPQLLAVTGIYTHDFCFHM